MKDRTCKMHGVLEEINIRRYIYKGYQCSQCRLCNKEYDKLKRRKEKYKEAARIRSRTPEEKEKRRIRAQQYKERRRILNRARHQRLKDDPEYRQKIRAHSKRKYERNKAAFDDNYIKKILKIYAKATPEQIENKRLQLLELYRKREERKLKKELEILLQEKIKKDREERGILKVCRVHGELTIDKVYLAKNGKVNANKFYFCTQCKAIKSIIHYHKYLEKIKVRVKIHRQNNREKLREYAKKWLAALPDAYVKRYFMKNEIKEEDIPIKLLELKRAALQLKRKLRDERKKEKI